MYQYQYVSICNNSVHYDGAMMACDYWIGIIHYDTSIYIFANMSEPVATYISVWPHLRLNRLELVRFILGAAGPHGLQSCKSAKMLQTFFFDEKMFSTWDWEQDRDSASQQLSG